MHNPKLIRIGVQFANYNISLMKEHKKVTNPLKCKMVHFADLLTPITFKPGGFEKKPRKIWRLGPQTWRLQKYAPNKNNERLFVSEYSLPYKCFLLYHELLYRYRELASQTVSLKIKL